MPEPALSAIEREAAEWVARIGAGELSDGERDAFDAWLARSAVHAAAFRDARAAWTNLGNLRQFAAEAEANAGLSTPPRQSDRASRGKAWPRRALAASLLLIVSLGAIFWENAGVLIAADHATGVGEVRVVALPDGSLAMLNTDSALSYNDTGDSRSITLLKGEALFTVVQDVSGGRPFVVEAKGVTVTALGTEFLVRAEGRHVDVKVLESRVSVHSDSQAETDAGVVLAANQGLRIGPSGEKSPVRPFEPTAATAWQRGKLAFDRAPLSDVVAEMNRYRSGTIVLLDGALRSQRVSGVFDIDRLDGAIGSIADEVGAEVIAIPPLLIALY